MTALAEALLAAQRQAIGALSKVYVHGADMTPESMLESLNELGCTDVVEQAQLLASLDVLRTYGAPAPPNGKPDPATEPASERQTAYIANSRTNET